MLLRKTNLIILYTSLKFVSKFFFHHHLRAHLTRLIRLLRIFIINQSYILFQRSSNIQLTGSLSVSKAIVQCSCRPLHKQSLKVNANLNSLIHRRYSDTKRSDEDEEPQRVEISSGLSNYDVFEDSNSPVILDIDEERRLLEENPEYFQNLQQKEKPNRFFGMNLKRGVTGVFDIEELITVLRNDNAYDIVTIAVPPEFRYVDYMVIVSGKTHKHLYAMAEYVRKLFKLKRSESDFIPKIEGYELARHYKTSPSGWLALDLGNIALHLFLDPVRQKYNLETLWSVGKEFDDLYNMQDDDYIALLKEHTLSSLDDLVPLDDSPTEEKKELA